MPGICAAEVGCVLLIGRDRWDEGYYVERAVLSGKQGGMDEGRGYRFYFSFLRLSTFSRTGFAPAPSKSGRSVRSAGNGAPRKEPAESKHATGEDKGDAAGISSNLQRLRGPEGYSGCDHGRAVIADGRMAVHPSRRTDFATWIRQIGLGKREKGEPSPQRLTFQEHPPGRMTFPGLPLASLQQRQFLGNGRILLTFWASPAR